MGRQRKRSKQRANIAAHSAAVRIRAPRSAGDTLNLRIETEAGPFVRTIATALPLPGDAPRGTEAEDAVADAAAMWGLPDFVFSPELDGRGGANREIGDRLIVVGDRAAAVQVKCRSAQGSTVERERAWTHKAIEKALRQAAGTARTLRRSPTRLTNARGNTMVIDGDTLQWVGVVVIDNDRCPDDLYPAASTGDTPTVVLLRRDWDFLFRQLRSTRAVLDYLRRAARRTPPALGQEAVRYYELAAADAAAPPGGLDPRLAAAISRTWSHPLLPQKPAGSDNLPAHTIVRILIEDIVTSRAARRIETADLHLLLSHIDRLPVGQRTELGELLIELLDTIITTAGEGTAWQFRRVISDDGSWQLSVGACSELFPNMTDVVRTHCEYRHHQLCETMQTTDVMTVTIVLTNRTDSLRSWDTTMVAVRGDLELEEAELAMMAELWGQNLLAG